MKPRPYLGMHCADCAIGTITLGEDYMVRDDVWEQAWAGRRKPWHFTRRIDYSGGEYLCISCLEKRISRTLSRDDFIEGMIIRVVRCEEPATYLKLIASVLPASFCTRTRQQ